VHPHGRVMASEGNVLVGEGCVIWERAVVGGSGEKSMVQKRESGLTSVDEEGSVEETKLVRNVIVEASAIVETGAYIGEGSVIEVGARVGRGSRIGKVTQLPQFPPETLHHSNLSPFHSSAR
jgi:dynactin 6